MARKDTARGARGLTRLLVLAAMLGSAVPVYAGESSYSQTGRGAIKRPDGTVEMPAFGLPQSGYLSEESRAAVRTTSGLEILGKAFQSCPNPMAVALNQVPEVRACHVRAFRDTPIFRRLGEKYAVELREERVGGVDTEVFTPKAGVAARNQKRVLINLHGGGFIRGARTLSQLESIPIADVMGIKVVSIDYRQAPEAVFPAASEDVVAVYRELLRDYAPDAIGMYGCSAGGMLAAQAVAMMHAQKIPMPGALGMFCGAGGNAGEGDSVATAAAREQRSFEAGPYYKGANVKDPLISPSYYPDVLRHFPPSLLISATRDHQLSSVVFTHSRLVALGVEADLHVWEGLSHAFIYDPDLAESEEAYRVTARFFDKHLAH